jgi:hypothetical protein
MAGVCGLRGMLAGATFFFALPANESIEFTSASSTAC